MLTKFTRHPVPDPDDHPPGSPVPSKSEFQCLAVGVISPCQCRAADSVSDFRFHGGTWGTWGTWGTGGTTLYRAGSRGSLVVPPAWTGGTWPVADQNLANPPQPLPDGSARWSCAGCPRGWWITEHVIVSHRALALHGKAGVLIAQHQPHIRPICARKPQWVSNHTGYGHRRSAGVILPPARYAQVMPVAGCDFG